MTAPNMIAINTKLNFKKLLYGNKPSVKEFSHHESDYRTSNFSHKQNHDTKIEGQKKLVEKIFEYDKLKSELVANLSHELRTPLSLIMSTQQLMESKIKDPETNPRDLDKYLKVIKNNSNRLLRFVNNAIDMTKVESEQVEACLSNIDMIEFIRRITLGVACFVSNKNLKFTFNSEFDKKIISLDYNKIQTALLNLLSNAVKFSEPGGTISVKVFKKDSCIAVSIKDSGIGMKQDELCNVFDCFRQIDKSLSRNAEGMGIGLSIVKAFVGVHNGSINVKSVYGEGSEFIIELPDTIRDCSNKSEEGFSIQQSQSDLMQKIQVEFSDIYGL